MVSHLKLPTSPNPPKRGSKIGQWRSQFKIVNIYLLGVYDFWFIVFVRLMYD